MVLGKGFKYYSALFVILSTVSCASRFLDYEKIEQLPANADYDKKMQVKEIESTPQISANETMTSSKIEGPSEGSVEKKLLQMDLKRGKVPEIKKQEKKMDSKKQDLQKKLPTTEDAEGFVGRRPIVDPFRAGEKVTLALSYFNMTAGHLDLEVLPFVEVNGVKSYKFQLTAKSNSIFSRFYSVDDRAVTFMSFDQMLPFNFEISVKESKQLADIKSFFDWKTLKGNYWEKRVTNDKGEKSKSLEWDIKPFSQNVISAIFYLRTFTLTPGKKISFWVADEGKNITFSAQVLRQEVLETAEGDLKTIVVKPQITVDGVFKPVGDIMIWLTDDDRKFVVRIESKIKIGTIVGKLKSIQR